MIFSIEIIISIEYILPFDNNIFMSRSNNKYCLYCDAEIFDSYYEDHTGSVFCDLERDKNFLNKFFNLLN
jgi:hypothetical protein